MSGIISRHCQRYSIQGDLRLRFGTPTQKAALLSAAQRHLVLESEPDDITGEEGCGVELHGSLYRTAKSLTELGLGHYSHGSPYGDLYFNNREGMAVRAAIAIAVSDQRDGRAAANRDKQ